MTNSIQCVVFDWDGTLMDSEGQIVHCLHMSIADLGLEPMDDDTVKNIIGLGLREAIDTLVPGRDAAFHRAFVEAYRKHWFAHDGSELFHGVREVLGFRYGYAGLGPDAHEPMALTPDRVRQIHEHGGTILGSSRGPQELDDMIRTLVQREVGVLFTIGGDGTLKGASALAQELQRRELPIGVIGIPKTIDNDLLWVVQSFGFSTAVEEALRAIAGANVEAEGAWNGVGIVKLMGRHSGFIAAHASLSNPDVNFCLIPEVPFALEGENGFLQTLERRLIARHHAVVVVAEGAGQELLSSEIERGRDASGNVRLDDVGTWLCERIRSHCSRRDLPVTIRGDAESTLQSFVTATEVVGQLGFTQVQIAAVTAPDG